MTARDFMRIIDRNPYLAVLAILGRCFGALMIFGGVVIGVGYLLGIVR